MTEPRFETLTAETATAYAAWLCGQVCDTLAAPLSFDMEAGVYSAPLSLGGSVEVWHDGSRVYGEA